MSHSNTGFVPLQNSRSNSNEMASTDIPLHQVPSRASSSGVRQPHQTSLPTTASMDEKRGLFNRQAGRRKKKQLEDEALVRKNTGGSDVVALNAMGKLYTKIVGASIVTRYLVYVVPVALLLAAPLIILPLTGHRDDIFVGNQGPREPNGPPVVGPPLFRLFVWIEVSWLSLWVGKLVASMIPSIFMFFCGVVSSGTRKYATVLKSLEIALSLFFWALASWQTFIHLFDEANDNGIIWVINLGRVLGALFVCSAVYLGEKAIVQLIGISYHQTSFANRIHASKREIHLLGMLYDASRTLFPMYCPEFAEEDYVINDSIDILLAGGKRGHKRGGSTTPMKIIGDVGRFGDKVTSVFGNIASEITGKKVFNPHSAHSIVVEALEKVAPSEALARRIWMAFVVEGKDALYLEDVQEVLGPAHKEEAEEAFNAIDNDQNGDISLDEMVRKVVEVGKERKAIAEGMKDISQALRVFDNVLLFVVFLVCIFIFLAFFQSSFITTLTTAGTALLSLSFIFAVTAQEFLGSCIFLFVKHPYDVGDRVDISGTQLTVDKISLLYTVFTRIDKMQVVQVPNIQLNNLWIENVSRSKAMKEVVEVNVSYDTSFEDIELLRKEMERFVRAPENSRDFQPDLAISIGGVGDVDKLNLKVVIKHKSNWHNDAVRGARRSKFMCALALALKKVPIYNPGGGNEGLGSHGNPSYSVAVTDDFAAVQRADAAKAKEAKRMVPSLPAAQGIKAEQAAITELNTRDPVVAAQDDWTANRDEKRTVGSVGPGAAATAAAATASGASLPGAGAGGSASRDASAERRRSNDIESVREQLLSKRESQKGRRAPGQGLPPLAFAAEGAPGVQLTQASPRMASFDEEAETGLRGTTAYPAGVYYGGGNTPFQSQQQQQQAAPGYSIFPPASRSPPGSSGSGSGIPATSGPPHPLQSQPLGAGQRSRGQSVSRAGQQQQQQGFPGGFR